MNTCSFTARKTTALVFALFALASTAFAGDVLLHKVPPLTVQQTPAYPANLARTHLGAQLQVVSAEKRAGCVASTCALLSGDPTASYQLNAGKTTLLISLAGIENIDSVSFLNSDARGTVTIATSSAKLPADSPQWQIVADQPLAPGAMKANIGPAEAKYVRISFNAEQPGRIAGLGVYATPAISDFTAPRAPKIDAEDAQSFALVSYSVSDVHARGRALYVSSGAEPAHANNIIDDQLATAYSFDAADGAPTAIIDLGKECKLDRIAAAFSPQAGSVEFYVMNSLPGTPEESVADSEASDVRPIANTSPGSTPDQLKVTAQTFANLKPVGSVVNTGNEAGASVKFPETAARYVMLKWNPASRGDTAFSLAEVAAFGGPKNRDVATDGKRMLGGGKEMLGKNILDNKDIPAEGPQPPAEGPPPALPPPPPFTFIPQVPPTSP